MASVPPDDRPSTVLANLAAATSLGAAFSVAVAAQAGLSTSELAVLEILLRRGPLAGSALASTAHQPTAAIDAALARLEVLGLAQRTDPATPTRPVTYNAAPGPGLAAVLAPYAALEAASRHLMTAYSAADLALLNRFLAEVISMANDQIATMHEQAISA